VPLLEIEKKFLARLDAGLPDGQRYSVDPTSDHAAWRLAQELLPWLDDRQAQKLIDELVKQGTIHSEWFQERPTHSNRLSPVSGRNRVHFRYSNLHD
jgi:hypothetical protein